MLVKLQLAKVGAFLRHSVDKCWFVSGMSPCVVSSLVWANSIINIFKIIKICK